MADVYEKNLNSKASLTVNDYIRVVGSDNVSYKQLVSDVANKIITTYTGASLAGSNQSVKSAIDSLNSNKADYIPVNTYTTNLNTAVDNNKAYNTNGSTQNRPPSDYGNYWYVISIGNESNLKQIAFEMATTSVVIYARSKNNNTWGNWVLLHH